MVVLSFILQYPFRPICHLVFVLIAIISLLDWFALTFETLKGFFWDLAKYGLFITLEFL